jgi:adenosylhomocysteine nucleosidase
MESKVRSIAILAAMSSELKPVARRLGLKRMPGANNPFLLGSYKGVPVIAAVTNMGLAAAQQRTQELFALRASIDHLFVVGIAGALQQSLNIGDVVIPVAVVDGRDGIERSPVNLSERAPAGVIYSSDELHYDDDYVAMLHQRKVSVVDMESGAIAAVCEHHGCPYTVIRAVSDRVDEHAKNFDVFHLANADGSPRYLAALRYMLTRPTQIGYLMAMSSGSKKAIAAATEELMRNIANLLLRN